MRLNLPPAAWLFLGLVLVIFIVSNVSLLVALTRRNRSIQKRKPPQVMRPSFTRPWQEEDERLSELSQKVKELQAREKGKDKN
jgi:hypothetical protein